jgi:hypothetical protein
LNQPSLFQFSLSAGHDYVRTLATFESKDVRNAYIKLLSYSGDLYLSVRHSVVFKAFPNKPAFFREDIRPYVKKIVEKSVCFRRFTGIAFGLGRLNIS